MHVCIICNCSILVGWGLVWKLLLSRFEFLRALLMDSSDNKDKTEKGTAPRRTSPSSGDAHRRVDKRGVGHSKLN